MEEMVRNTGRLQWVILRGGIFVGRGTFQDGLMADLRNGRAVVPGDGSSFISPIHVTDMAAAVAAALRKAPAGSTAPRAGFSAGPPVHGIWPVLRAA